jgi:excisionase family DNA binding protein
MSTQKNLNSHTWLTRREVAAYLKLSVRQIDYMTEAGTLPFALIGTRTKRYHRETIDSLLLKRQMSGKDQ